MTPRKILIAYHDAPPIAHDLARSFERLGLEVGLFITDHHRHAPIEKCFKTLHKLAQNIGLVGRMHEFMAWHPWHRGRFLARACATACDRFQPDYVLVIHGEPFHDQFLSQLKIPKIGWWIEPDDMPIARIRRFAAPFDVYASFNCRVLRQIDGHCLHTTYLSHAVAPERFYPADGPGPEYDLLFVGNWSVAREQIIERLLQVTSNVALYGPGWRKKTKIRRDLFDTIFKGEWVGGERLNSLYCCSRITLNANRVSGSGGLNMRFFEALAARACLLTDAPPELALHFAPGEHLAIYNDLDDLEDKARALLGDAPLRARIRRAGHERVTSAFTYDGLAKKFVSLFEAAS